MLSLYCNLGERQVMSSGARSPEEEIPQWVLAEVEEEDGQGEEGRQEKRSS